MKNSRYGILKQIIDLYEDFEAHERHLDLLSFGRWIVKTLEDEPGLNEMTYREKIPAFQNDNGWVFRRMDEKARFLESVSRIARYHELYSRKALKELVINSRLEYLFLQTIGLMKQAKKTDLINVFNLEYTTGMDTIRRLTSNGLLNEVQDETDKRAKLLVLTEKGETILAQANKRMAEENKMFLMAINDNKWKKALAVLEEIDDFHGSIYQSHSNKSFAELNNLMDSLKYLHK